MPLQLLAILILFLSSCTVDKPVAIPTNPDAAVKAIRSAYRPEIWSPRGSSAIYRVEHYPSSERLFLIVTFRQRKGGHSKPYPYEKVPSSLFRDWMNAPSAGKWFNTNLKGNTQYAFRGTGVQ